MAKSFKLAVAFALLAILLAAPAAMAQSQTNAPPRRGFAGVVVSYDGTSLVVNVDRPIPSGDVTFTITDTTTIVGDITAGTRVAVLADQVNNAWQAVYVVVADVTNPIQIHIGAVVSVSSNTITIALPDGTTFTATVPAGAEVPPVGQMVSLFARVRAGAAPGDPPEMTGWQSAEQVRLRMEAQLQQLIDQTNLPPSAVRNRSQLLLRIADRLEQQTQLHVQLMDQVCQQVCNNTSYSSQVRQTIQQHLQVAQQAQQAAQQKAQEARGNAGGGGSGGSGGSGGGPGGNS